MNVRIDLTLYAHLFFIIKNFSPSILMAHLVLFVSLRTEVTKRV